MQNEIQKVQPLYRCSQDKILDIMDRGWHCYISGWEKFSDYSDAYTLQYGESVLNEIKNVRLKSDSTPFGSRSDIRYSISNSLKESLFQHRLLQSHIKRSYPLFLRKSKLRDGGVSLYRKASRRNWDSLNDLLKKGEEFLKENHEVLSEYGMPASFPEKYFKTAKDFQELLDKYKAIMKYNDEEAANRIKQLNQLYIQTIDMFSDAQLIMKGKVFRSLSLTQSMNYYKRKNKKKGKQLQLALQIKPVRKNKKKEKISKQKAA